MKYFKYTIFIFMLFFVSCGPERGFNSAKRLENKGYYVEAGLKYEDIYKNYPEEEFAPEALFRLAGIYQKKLELYSQARKYFDILLERYPGSDPWAELAKLGLFNSPDYFPLNEGNFWIEGDSNTKGENMRSEWKCQEVSTGTFYIPRRMYAGKSFVTQINGYYVKKDMELRERESLKSNKYMVRLKYPFIAGKSWATGKDGRKITCRILGAGKTVDVKAGTFSDCIKVSESYEDLPGSVKYVYYAPRVGWVLTTTARVGGIEHRNSELISYKIIP